MHALAEYGLMNVKLYEDIVQLRPHRDAPTTTRCW